MAILRPPAPQNPPASAIPGLPGGGGPTLEPAPAPSPAWHTLCEAFFADRPGLTPKTIWSYNQAFAIWKALIGDRPIAAVRRGDVKLFGIRPARAALPGEECPLILATLLLTSR